MNKRISTLMTASLLFSSAFGSAYAEKKSIEAFIKGIATEIKTDGTQYLIIEDNGTNKKAEANSDYALGFKYASEDNTDKVSVLGDALSTVVDEEALKQYLWTAQLSYVNTVNETQPYYIFTNVKTGKVLTVNASSNAFITDFSEANKTNVEAGTNFFSFADYVIYGKDGASTTAYNQQLYVTKAALNGNYQIVDVSAKELRAVTSPVIGDVINIYEPTENVALEDSELNELYNGKGFSFVLEDDEIDNMFGFVE